MNFFTVSGDDPTTDEFHAYYGPSNRSGHRTFVSEDFLFVIGGFSKSGASDQIHVEIWRMNLASRIWESMELCDGFPTHLASFGISQVESYSSSIMLHGGTGFPFGDMASNRTYILRLDSPDRKIKCAELRTLGDKPVIYGHAFLRATDTVDNSTIFYSVGGTSGHEYFLDVHRLKFEKSDWVWTHEGIPPPDYVGLYRFEVVQDKEKLIFFGGGTQSEVRDFVTLTMFDTVKKVYEEKFAHPDPVFGFPHARRCHSVTRFGRNIIIAGGCGCDEDDEDVPPMRVEIYNDVWLFNLDSFQWTMYPAKMLLAVFFHDAAITKDGCLYIFGGVCDQKMKLRTNLCQAVWLQPPSLRYLSASKILSPSKESPDDS